MSSCVLSGGRRDERYICVNGVKRCVFLFFFKQKTAYEIYQCDWSSDVCSSDLGDASLFIVKYDSSGHVLWAKSAANSMGNGVCTDKIGRASCRERV